jgi:hypothetical protein
LIWKVTQEPTVEDPAVAEEVEGEVAVAHVAPDAEGEVEARVAGLGLDSREKCPPREGLRATATRTTTALHPILNPRLISRDSQATAAEFRR